MRAWTTAFIPQSVTLLEAIDDYVSDLLEVTNVDWYNNDGGFGELHISVQNGTYSFDVSTRYTESTCVHAVQCSVDEVLT